VGDGKTLRIQSVPFILFYLKLIGLAAAPQAKPCLNRKKQLALITILRQIL
jgi:hypothetical protein